MEIQLMLQKAAEITEHLGCFSTGPVISWDKRLLFYIMGAGVLSMILTSPGSNVSPLFLQLSLPYWCGKNGDIFNNICLVASTHLKNIT